MSMYNLSTYHEHYLDFTFSGKWHTYVNCVFVILYTISIVKFTIQIIQIILDSAFAMSRTIGVFRGGLVKF